MRMLKWIPPKSNLVIEFGCLDGSLAEKFKQINPACKYIGVESDIENAKLAEKKVDNVLIDDIRHIDLLKSGVFLNSVECFIYQNIIKWNDETLAAITKQIYFLKDNGQVIIDFPNNSYVKNSLGLLVGDSNIIINIGLDRLTKHLKNIGLVIYSILPYMERKDEALKKDDTIIKTMQNLVDKTSIEGNINESVWYKGYIVRAIKSVKLPESFLIHTILGEKVVCARPRIIEPNSFCSTIPGMIVVNDDTGKMAISHQYNKKVVIFQRILFDLPQLVNITKTLMEKGFLILYEIDDYPEIFKRFKENKYFAFRGCHGIQTATPALAKYLEKFNPNVAVFPNQMATLPPMRKRLTDKVVHIFFGAVNREEDWKKLMPVLNEVFAQYKNKIQVHVIYDKQFYDALEFENKEYIPFCNYHVYSETLHRSDIALLPLNDNDFNCMKSDLKFIECAAHGVATLASPTVYKNTIKHGINGFIYNDLEEFKEYLLLLIENDELRQAVADNAYRYVANNRLLVNFYEERYMWYSKMIDNLPELNRELIKRNPELRFG